MRRLSAEGATVYAGYHSSRAAVDALVGAAADDAGRIVPLAVDVTDSESVGAAFERVVSDCGRIDALVCAAGGPADALLLRVRDRALDESLRLNLTSAVYCARAALPTMLKRRYGRIALVGSVVASTGNEGQSVYAAAKAGLEGFARSLAREVGTRGITVNCVAPGRIDTEMTRTLPDAHRERVLAATALRRVGTVDEVADAVAYLCAQQASYVTGAVLHVNGGMFM